MQNDMKPLQFREALLILNGQVSHQETKVAMIVEGLIYICFGFLPYPHSDEVVAEALNLLGSLLSVKKGRDQLKSGHSGRIRGRVTFRLPHRVPVRLPDELEHPNPEKRGVRDAELDIGHGRGPVPARKQPVPLHHQVAALLTRGPSSSSPRTSAWKKTAAFWSTCCTLRSRFSTTPRASSLSSATGSCPASSSYWKSGPRRANCRYIAREPLFGCYGESIVKLSLETMTFMMTIDVGGVTTGRENRGSRFGADRDAEQVPAPVGYHDSEREHHGSR